jgi:opacity protein-like surface antigen
MRLKSRVLLTALVLVAGLPSSARADGFVSPFLGWTTSGQGVENRLHYGVNLGGMANEIIGFEMDLAFAPNFFELSEEDFGDFSTDGSVTTLMGNVIVGVPIGTDAQIRPYISGGAGLIRFNVESPIDFFDEASRNDFGLNVGGGAMLYFSRTVGVRGDIRYFRSLNDEDPSSAIPVDLGLANFDFWRATGGVTFRF